MEMISIVMLVAVLVIVVIYFGFGESIETGARMANRRIERAESEQIKADVEYYSTNEIKDTNFKKAEKQKELMKKYRSL